ncbi:hypothetical protein ACRZJO_004504 [Citrobacter freundii]|uniref:hypothetical protein n=1 Tax=Citrobacter freundii complex TaxID=1344959 RepID=UPI000CDCF9F7|nr:MULTISPECIES: hypothetical protein [Citrobacter freundii complex]NTY71163.1 hypothetical protein [Citrobacter freundii]POU42955.1 hypothetical protein C3375_19685 [Citrobacter freundii complex sp. CFNIH12]QLX64617.1 hypothetical protein HV171_16925 [Citrobacter freundii]HAT7518592.1 hypothetical protein [Citrobacter freundii]HEI8709517.1 hypothetical protein [Citrobacter freundii]
MKYTMKVYANSPEYGAYLKSRFGGDKRGQSFEWAGHRWAYEVTSFDDAGDYDLLYRFDDKPYPEEVSVSTDDMTIRDYFAAKAMAAIVRRWDGHSFGGGPKSPQHKELAEDAYHIADAMLRAREAS